MLPLFLLIGYLLGSLPFASLVARLHGVDIFRVGTGNPGAANVFQQIGPRVGIAVFLADAAKGATAFLLPRLAGEPEWVSLGAGMAAIVGHWAPILLRFRGGGGLATAIGVAFAAFPWAGLIGVAAGLPTLALLRSSGPAALIGFIVIGVSASLMGQPSALIVGVLLLPSAVTMHLTVFHQRERSRRRVLPDERGPSIPLPATPQDGGRPGGGTS